MHTPFQPEQPARALAEALGWRTVKLSLEPPLDSDEYDYLEHIERWVAALAGSGNE